MTGAPLPLLLIIALGLLALAAVADEQYPLGPESQPQDVPHGVVTHYTWVSKIFPGTTRDYWVYVPAQYTADKPACVMVFQDGGGPVNEKGRLRIPVVFDNLIAAKATPVTIGIFINPGMLPPPGKDMPGRPNRSFEYDAISDRYARFLTEEILPEVGKHYNLSQDPNDHAICGLSSGGICAFTAAWFRPDAFRRVLSFVGSFSNLRGGDAYPSMIRKTETKPIRVFIQSGKHDMNTYAGSWYIQNQAMAGAFEYMGYDYKVVLGEEGHNDLQGASVLPDALRWLWRDWPQPITAPVPPAKREWATNIVDPKQGWEPVEGLQNAVRIAADAQGDVFVFGGAKGFQILKLDAAGKVTSFAKLTAPLTDIASGPGGEVFALEPGGLIAYHLVSFSADGVKRQIAKGEAGPGGLAVDERGGAFLAGASGHLWFVDPSGKQRLAWDSTGVGMALPGGVHLLPGGSLLAVSDIGGRWVWSLRVEADGSLTNPEPFYRLETADETSETEAQGMTADDQGLLYVATKLGIQVCDQEGRTAFIIANPPAGAAHSIAFGGPDRQTLFAVAGGKLFRRLTLRKGAAN